MAMQDLVGLNAAWPHWYAPNATGVPAFATTNATIDAAAEKFAVIFEAPKTGTINLVEFLTRTVTFGGGSVLRVSFQSLASANGDPDGTQSQFRDVTGLASNTWTVTGLITSDGTDTGTKRSVTVGDIFAVVFEYQTFTAADSVIIGALTQSVSFAHVDFPYCDLFTASWTQNAVDAACIALKYSDDSYAIPLGCIPISAVADNTFNSGSTPDERGLLFQTPVPLRIRGVRYRSSIASGADTDIVIYDSGGSALRTASRDGNFMTTTSITGRTRIFSPLDLAANVNYRAVLKPTTGTNTSLVEFTFASSNIANAFAGNSTWKSATRTDAGAWTDTADVLPMLSLIVSGADDGVCPPQSIRYTPGYCVAG